MIKKNTLYGFIFVLCVILLFCGHSAFVRWQDHVHGRGTIDYELYGIYEMDTVAFQEEMGLSTDFSLVWFAWMPSFEKMEGTYLRHLKGLSLPKMYDNLFRKESGGQYSLDMQPIMITFGRALENLQYHYDDGYTGQIGPELERAGIERAAFSDVVFAETYCENTAYIYIKKSDVVLYPSYIPLKWPNIVPGSDEDERHGHTYSVIKNGKKVYWGNSLRYLNGLLNLNGELAWDYEE